MALLKLSGGVIRGQAHGCWSLVVGEYGDSRLGERARLAGLLRDYLKTNPEPITGSVNHPFPSADLLGIEGLSILGAFFVHVDMEIFTCAFGGDRRSAAEHQKYRSASSRLLTRLESRP